MQWVASKVTVIPSLTLHATHCVHSSMNVRKMNHLDMTIAADWDVKPQNNNNQNNEIYILGKKKLYVCFRFPDPT